MRFFLLFTLIVASCSHPAMRAVTVPALAVTASPTATPVPPSPRATVAPTPAAAAAAAVNIPVHVQTADYTTMTPAYPSPAAAAPYVSIVYGKASAWHPVGVQTITYENPFMPAANEWREQAALAKYPDVRANDCTGSPVHAYSGAAAFADLSKPDAAAYVQAVMNAYDGEDYQFLDNANDLYGVTPMPCAFSSYAAWTIAFNKMTAALSGHVFLNTLSGPEAYSTPPAGLTAANQIAGLASPAVVGGEYEGCYTSPVRWADAEQTELDTIKAHKTFWCYANGSWSKVDPASPVGVEERMFAYASFLLTYDPARSIYQTWFTTPSGFKVMPETGFVATDPVYGVSKIGDIKYSGGAYARTYRGCYFRGERIAFQCEVVVNPGSAPVPVPNASQYNHSLVLTGSSVLDGGNALFDGPALKTLPVLGAAVLLKY